MRKVRTFFVLFILSIGFVANVQAAAPKFGDACPKLGKKVVSKGYEYLCIKKNMKFVWSKGILVKTPTPTASPISSALPTPTPTPTLSPVPVQTPSAVPTYDEATFEFKDICQEDPFIPSQWAGMEQRVNRWKVECSWPYRIVKKQMPDKNPKSLLDENVQSADQCKLAQNPSKGALVAWPLDVWEPWSKFYRHLSLNSVVSLIPIYTKDAPDNGRNPYEDYKPYLDFLQEWVDHASDGKGKLTVKSPTRYIQLDENIREYNLTHERPQYIADRFRETIEQKIVPKIDLNGVNLGIIVLPAGSDFSLVQQVGLGQIRIGNNFMRLGIEPSFTLKDNLTQGSNFIHPAWWLHELHHVTTGFDDNDKDSPDGLHMWGLMSYGANEMLGWHKWIAGIWNDDRIHCIETQKGGTYWIAPNVYQTLKKKLIVIPVSSTKGIIVESMRAGGMNYKMPKFMEGVLVYGIDNTTTGQHTGSFILKPTGRKLLNPTLPGLSRTFINSDAALKEGEYTTYQGWKISVIESGEFGDVIKIEKTK